MSSFSATLLRNVAELLADSPGRTAVLGRTPAGLEAAALVRRLAGDAALIGIFDPDMQAPTGGIQRWDTLAQSSPEILVIAADADKERLLLAAASALDGHEPLPRVALAGIAHQEQPTDEIFDTLEAPALVPSYATGHPHTRAHLYDCLSSAAAAGRSGAIVVLGAFKGGTSVWLAKAAAAVGLHESPVIAFDSWDGFPPKRSLLDLYEHPRCVFRDFDAVRAYTEPYNIELVAGDIYETAPSRLASEPVLLAFVDTDNFSGTRRALETIAPNLVTGGAIIFDHFYTTQAYAYTVGERLAGRTILNGRGLLHLHGTGVFVNVG